MPYCDTGDVFVQFDKEVDRKRYQSILSRSDVQAKQNPGEEALKRFISEYGSGRVEEVNGLLPGIVDGFSPRTQKQMRETVRYMAFEEFKELVDQQKNDEYNEGPVEITEEAWKNELKDRLLKEIKAATKDAGEWMNVDNRDQVDPDSVEGEQFAAFVAEELHKALSNMDTFWMLAQNDFRRLGLEPDASGTYTAKRGGDYSQEAWEDYARFFTSNQQTASTEVKMILGHINNVDFKRDEDGYPVEENGEKQLVERRNYINYRSFLPLDKVWNKVGSLLADEFPRTFDNFMDVLKEAGEHSPIAHRVHERFNKPEKREGDFQLYDTTKKSFTSAFGKHYANFKYVLMMKGNDNDSGWNPYVGDSDRIQQGERIVEEWKDAIPRSEITYYDDKEAVRVDQEKVESLRQEYMDILDKYHGSNPTPNYKDDAFVKEIHRLLHRMGLEPPYSYLRAMSQGQADPSWMTNFAGKGKRDVEKNSTMGALFRSLLRGKNKRDEDPLLSEVNPLLYSEGDGVNSRKRLRNLAHQSVPYQDNIWAPSATFVTGDRYFALQDHERITRQIQVLKEADRAHDKRTKDPFNTHSVLLKNLSGQSRGDQKQTKRRLDVKYVDGMTVQNRNADERVDDLSPEDNLLTSVAMFQNKGNSYHLHNALTLSDRSRSFVLQAPHFAHYYSSGDSNMWEPNINVERDSDDRVRANVQLGSQERSALLEAAMSELDRIKKVQEKNEELGGPENHPLGEDYGRQGQKLFLFPLNPEQIEEKYGKEMRERIWQKRHNKPDKLKHPEDFENQGLIANILTDWMEAKTEETIYDWSGGRVWNAMNNNYLKNRTPFTDRAKEKAYAAVDYTLSQVIGHVEMMRLFHGDPAEFAKVPDGDPTFEEVKQATLGEMQKRLAKAMGPALTSDFNEDSTYNFVTLEDVYTTVNQFEQYDQFLEDSDAFDGIESTDAQEYVTLEEYIRVGINYGIMDKDEVGDILNKVSGNDPEYRLTEEEMARLDLKARKPFYSGEREEQQADMLAQMMVKTSSFPLVPNIVDGGPLGEVRKAMERSGVDRAAYGSGVKVGARHPVSLTDDNDNFRDADTLVDQFQGNDNPTPSEPAITRGNDRFEDLTSSGAALGADDVFKTLAARKKGGANLTPAEKEVLNANEQKVRQIIENEENLTDSIDRSMHSLRREGFGLQFIIPSKKDRISVSTQGNQLMLAGNHSGGITLPDGEEIGINEYYERKRMYNRSIMAMEAQRIAEEVGAEIESDAGVGTTTSPPEGQAIKDMVLREARERNWDASQIQEIEDIAADEFEKPLSFTGAGTKIENLLMSIISSRVTKRKTHGRAFVQASSMGLTWEDPSDTDIVFHPDYDASTKPSHVTVERGEDGDIENVNGAQIIVPWFFKDEDGSLLDMQDYMKTTEEGKRVMDFDKMDEELLEAMGYRIPNQGPSSNVPVEIVGFLPPSFYNVAFVPDGIVPQMGSDFDVDKLNTMLREYEVSDGNLQRKDTTTAQKTFLEPDNNPEIQLKKYDSDVRTALDEGYLDLIMGAAKSKEHVKNILQPLDRDDLKGEKEVLMETFTRDDFLFPTRQQTDFKLQLAGKDLIGISSVAARMNLIFQNTPQATENQVQVRDNKGDDVRTLSQLGTTEEIRSSYSKQPLTAHDAITLYQNSAVDNAKEFDLGPLGVNVHTAEALFPLLMMSDEEGRGPQIEHATRFLRQPIIRSIVQNIEQRRSNLEAGSSLSALDDAITDVVETWLERYKGVDLESMDSFAQPVISSPEQLLEDIRTADAANSDADLSSQFVTRQLQAAKAFSELVKVNEDVQQINSAFNFGNRRGPGKSLIEAGRHTNSIEKLKNNGLSNAMEVGGELQSEKAEFLVPSTEEGDYAKYTFLFAEELFGSLFRYDATPFQGAMTHYEDVMGDTMREDQVFDMWNEFTAAVYHAAGLQAFDETPSQIRKRLLYNTDPSEVEGDEGSPSLARRLQEARRDGWANQHPFLQFIEIDRKSSTEPYGPTLPDDGTDSEEASPEMAMRHEPDELKYNATKLDDAEKLRIRRDLARLLSKPIEEHRRLAEDLIKYHMFVQGKKRSPRTFDEFIPPRFYRDMGITDAIQDMDLDSFMSSTGAGSFLEQYVQNNPYLAPRLTEELMEEVSSEIIGPRINFENDSIPSELRYQNKQGEKVPVPYISFFDESVGRFRLFTYHGDGYSEIPVLGDATGAAKDLTEYQIDGEAGRRSSDVKLTASGEPIGHSAVVPTSGETNWNYGIYSYHMNRGGQGLQDTMTNLAVDEEVSSDLQVVARVIQQMSGEMNVNVVPGSGLAPNVPAAYRNGDVVINDGFTIPEDVNMSTKDFSAAQLVHESLHAVTKDLISRELQKDSSDQSRQVRELKKLQKEVQKKILDREDVSEEEFRRFMTRYQKAREGENVQFETDHLDLFKAVATPDELVSAFFTNRRFQEWANSQESSEDTSFWERMLDWVQRFVNAFIEEMDMEVRRDSLLERGIRVSASTVGQKAELFSEGTSSLNQGKSTQKEVLSTEKFALNGTHYRIQSTTEGTDVQKKTDQGWSEVTGENRAMVMSAFESHQREKASEERSTDSAEEGAKSVDKFSAVDALNEAEDSAEESSEDIPETDGKLSMADMIDEKTGEVSPQSEDGDPNTFEYTPDSEKTTRTYVVTQHESGSVDVRGADGERVMKMEERIVKEEVFEKGLVEQDLSVVQSALRTRRGSLGDTIGQVMMKDMTDSQRSTFRSLRKHIETQRDSSGNHYINGVYAPNGEPSQLFEDILDRTDDQKRALLLYLNVKNSPILDEHQDRNGEAKIEAVVHRDDLGFGRRERAGHTHLSASASTKAADKGAIDQVIDQLYNARNRLFNQRNRTEDVLAKGRINQQISRISNQIQSLRSEKSLKEIEAVYEQHISYVESIVSRENPTTGEINFARYLAESWDFEQYTSNYVNERDRSMKSALLEASSRMETLQTELKDAESDIWFEQVRKDFPDAVKENVITLGDSGTFETWTGALFDLEKWDNKLITQFQQVTKEATQSRNSWATRKRQQLTEAMEGVEDSSRLLQRDENGDPLLAISNPYTADYYAKHRATMEKLNNSMRSAKYSENVIRRIKASFIDDITETDDVVDIRYLIEELEDDGEFENPDAYIQHLKERYGEEVGRRAARQAVNLYRDYRERMVNHRRNLRQRYGESPQDLKEGESLDEYVERNMAEWKRKNDPLIAMKEIMEGSVERAYNRGYKSLHFVGKPEYQNDRFYSRGEYKEDGLTQTEREAARDLRDFFDSLMQELPQHKTEGYQDNFMPRVRKDWLETATSEGWAAGGKQVYEDWIDEFTGEGTVGLFEQEGNANAFSGLTEYSDIPVKYLSDPINKTAEKPGDQQVMESLRPEEESLDVEKAAEKFMLMVGNYKHMSDVRDTVEIMGRKIREMTTDLDNKLSGSSNKPEIIRKALRHHVNSLMFQQSRSEETHDRSFMKEGTLNPLKNWEAWKEKEALRKRHRKLKEQLDNNEISRSEYQEEVEKIDEEMRELNGVKVSWGRLLESTLGRATMIKGLGWSVTSAISNAMFGYVANSIEASSGEYFDDQDLWDAMMTFIRLQREGSQKIGNLMQKFDVFFEVNELAAGTKAKNEKKAKIREMIENPMTLMNDTETFVQGLTMLAYLKGNTTTVEVDGETKEIDLYNAFDEQGRWNEEKWGPNPEFQDTGRSTEFNKHASIVTGLIKRIHGNYHAGSPQIAKMTSWGRMLTQFRTWMFEGASYRWGKEQEMSKMNTIKGSYTSAKDLFLDQDIGMRDMLSIVRSNNPEAKAEELGIDKTDAFNLRRAAREARWFLRTSMLLLVLGSMMTGGDDEERNGALTMAYNYAWRINADSVLYMNPGTAMQLVNDPVPAYRTLTDTKKTIETTASALSGGDVNSRAVTDQWMRTLPGLNNYYTWQWMTGTTMDQVTETSN